MKIMNHQCIRYWLICAYFIFLLSFVAAKWQCNNTTECTCNPTVFNRSQCSCQVDNATVTAELYFINLEISCETTNKPGPSYLSYFNAIKLNESISKLKIDQCPTPNISLTNFLKNVNISTISEIEILSDSTVDTFQKYHFENLSNVIKIKIRTKMTKLPDTIFNDMLSLENVVLSENALITLSRKIFANNTKISQLELASNNLNNLDEGIFSKTYKLNKLDISHNALSSLPPYLFANATSLRSFNISNNSLTTLPEHLFDNCSELQTFECKGNHLKQLPELIFKHNSKLEKLDISENQITFLNDTLFSSLKNLKTLKLAANRLKSINSKVFATLQSLEILNLYHNNLEFFEEKTFQSLSKVSSINLSHNPLGKNQSLANFSLFASCAKLEKLYLQNTSLTKVIFNRNNVSFILANLDLSFNNLTSFMLEEMLIKLKSYHSTEVNLSNNNITKISSEGLQNSIEKWCPKGCKETTIKFNLTNNPIECNCHVFHMAKHMQQKPVFNKLINYPNVIFEVSCNSPKFLRNKSLDKIPLHDLQCCLDETHCEENVECAGGCRYQYHDSDKNAVIVNCTGERLEKLPKQLLKFDKPYKELLLANNNLTNLDGLSSLSSIANITKLSLSHNNLEEVYQLEKFDKLEVLELDNNKINRLPHELIKQLRDSKTLISLTLHNNPWHCECQTQDFINLVKFLWKNKTDIKCQNNQSITSLKDDLCLLFDSSYIYILLVLLGILIIIIVELHYIFEYEIKAWMFANKFCLSFVSKPYTNEGKIYDIFISASAKDEEFVVNQLLPRLDNKYKLSIQPRDITAEDLSFKMSNSNRIVIILSLNYLRNELDDDNFRTMFLAALENHIANILVIVINNIDVEEIDSDLQAFITNKPLKWGKRLFWEKLKYELPHLQRNTGSSDLDEIELATIAIN